MFDAKLRQRLCWTGGGVVLGLLFGGLWPSSPAHAVATSQIDSFSVCTAPVDEEGEAIFFLDYLTGDLKGAALNPNTGKFTAFFGANVANSLGVDITKNPRYLLVSGIANFRRGNGNGQLGNSALYVGELTSGKVVAYGIPWLRAARNAAMQPTVVPLLPLDSYQFRNVQVRNP